MILDQLGLPQLKAAFNENKVAEQLTGKINLHNVQYVNDLLPTCTSTVCRLQPAT